MMRTDIIDWLEIVSQDVAHALKRGAPKEAIRRVVEAALAEASDSVADILDGTDRKARLV